MFSMRCHAKYTRHPELVSGSIYILDAGSATARWTLKQVQGDGLLGEVEDCK